MAVPSICPCDSVSVDFIQKQMVEEPNVSRVVDVKAFICFQISEKCFPLATEPFCDIIPDPLNPAVMNTPDVRKPSAPQCVGAKRAKHTFPRYMSLFRYLDLPPSIQLPSHSLSHGLLVLSLVFHEHLCC